MAPAGILSAVPFTQNSKGPPSNSPPFTSHSLSLSTLSIRHNPKLDDSPSINNGKSSKIEMPSRGSVFSFEDVNVTPLSDPAS